MTAIQENVSTAADVRLASHTLPLADEAPFDLCSTPGEYCVMSEMVVMTRSVTSGDESPPHFPSNMPSTSCDTKRPFSDAAMDRAPSRNLAKF